MHIALAPVFCCFETRAIYVILQIDNVLLVKGNAFISAVQYYLPEEVEDNAEVQLQYRGASDLELLEKIGIKSRHVAPKGIRASDMAAMAAERLFSETAIDRKDIDALIYCSCDRDYIVPMPGTQLQDRVGLSKKIATIDIGQECSGYVYSLAVAKGLIHTLGMQHVLMLTSATPTKYVYQKNLAVRMVFGDAASATLISRAADDVSGGIGEFVFGTDGANYDRILIKDGAEANGLTERSYIEHSDEFGNAYTDSTLYIDGQHNILFIIKQVPKLIQDTLERNGLLIDDIDLFVMHQANYFALEQVRKKLKINEPRFFYSMERTGNTLQATIPIALKNAQEQGKIKQGDKVLIAGFGAGMNMAATVLTF